jgi:hypothetical protein
MAPWLFDDLFALAAELDGGAPLWLDCEPCDELDASWSPEEELPFVVGFAAGVALLLVGVRLPV